MDSSDSQRSQSISSTEEEDIYALAGIVDSSTFLDLTLPDPRDVRPAPTALCSRVRLKSILTRATPDRLLSPRTAANEIRRFRDHQKATVAERHREGFCDVPSEYKEKLKALCMRFLLLYDGKSNNSEASDIAEEEFRNLVVHDSLVRMTFHECIVERNNWATPLLCDFIKPETEVLHSEWSGFLGYRLFESRDEKYRRFYCESLKQTLGLFSNPPLTDRAIDWPSIYLSHALLFNLNGKDLAILADLWRRFLGELSNDLYDGGWESMNTCVDNILSSGKPIGDFLSPSHLLTGQLPAFLTEHAFEAPTIFNAFFAVPQIKIRRESRKIVELEFYYPPYSEWTLQTASSYSIPFLNAALKFGFFQHTAVKTFEEYQSYIKSYLFGSRLSQTVFTKDSWIHLYYVSDYVTSSYLRGRGLRSSGVDPQLQSSLLGLAFRIVTLLSSTTEGRGPFTLSRNMTEPALAAFYFSQTVAIDRYCKRTIYQALHYDPVAIALMDAQPNLLKSIHVSKGVFEVAYIPLFRNVPYLRRFKINRHMFIASNSLPELSAEFTGFKGDSLHDLSVDIMEIGERTVTLLRVDDDDGPFDSTGHYPILAGEDESGGRFYVAAVRLEQLWYFTTVRDGVTRVFYTDEDGATRTTSSFFVLALRYDPVDLQPPHPAAYEGAMDPTGPLFWRRLWSNGSPEYCDTVNPIASRDNRVLQSLLSEIVARDDLEHDYLNGFS